MLFFYILRESCPNKSYIFLQYLHHSRTLKQMALVALPPNTYASSTCYHRLKEMKKYDIGLVPNDINFITAFVKISQLFTRWYGRSIARYTHKENIYFISMPLLSLKKESRLTMDLKKIWRCRTDSSGWVRRPLVSLYEHCMDFRTS
jgi:hypothetical protein